MVSVVFSSITINASAKPGKTARAELGVDLSVAVQWMGKGYDIKATIPGSADVRIEAGTFNVDRSGKKTFFEMKPLGGSFYGFIPESYMKRNNELYLVVVTVPKKLLLDDLGTVETVNIKVIEIEFKGRKDNIKIRARPVINNELFLNVEFIEPGISVQDTRDSRIGAGKGPIVFIEGINSKNVRIGVGSESHIKNIQTLRLITTVPDFSIDSFFDVFFEIDFYPPEPGKETNVDSFFDVFFRLESERMDIDSFFDVFYRHNNKGDNFYVDSFFDVFYKTASLPDEAPGGAGVSPFLDVTAAVDYGLPYPGRLRGDFPAESFFDVLYEVEFQGPIRHPAAAMETKGKYTSGLSGGPAEVDDGAKYVNLGTGSLRARVSGIRLQPFSMFSCTEGMNTKTRSIFDVFTELNFGVPAPVRSVPKSNPDSFFDVFTELSFNPVRAWIDPEGGIQLNSFFDVFNKVAVNGNDWDLVGYDDNDWEINADDHWEAPNVLAGSFFDVFTSYEPTWFAETLPDDFMSYTVDSFFDVFFEITVEEKDDNWHQNSRFEIDIESGTSATATALREIDGMSAKIEVLEYQEGGVNYKSHKILGPTRFSNIILRKGVSAGAGIHDLLKNVIDGNVERRSGEIRLTGDLTPDDDIDSIINWGYNSFFDVFFDIEVELPDERGGTIETEIVSMDLKSGTDLDIKTKGDVTNVLIVLNESLRSVMLKKDGLSIDSFFDVFYDTSGHAKGLGKSPFHIDSFFDVFYKLDESASTADEEVKDVILKIQRLSHTDAEQLKSPKCELKWGQNLKFKNYITSLSEKYVKFTPDGTPVRCVMNVRFTEHTTAEEQTSRTKYHSESSESDEKGNKKVLHEIDSEVEMTSNLKLDPEADLKTGEGSLKIDGFIKGKYESDKIDLDCHLTLRPEFEYQNKRFTSTLASGGIDVKVKSSQFKQASIGNLEIDAEVKIGSSDENSLKLQGEISGKYENNGMVDLDGKISVKSDFTYKKGKVTATLNSGSLKVKVKSSEFKYAELSSLQITMDIKIPEASELDLEGHLKGKYDVDKERSDTGGSGNFYIDSFFDVYTDITPPEEDPDGSIKIKGATFNLSRGIRSYIPFLKNETGRQTRGLSSFDEFDLTWDPDTRFVKVPGGKLTSGSIMAWEIKETDGNETEVLKRSRASDLLINFVSGQINRSSKDEIETSRVHGGMDFDIESFFDGFFELELDENASGSPEPQPGTGNASKLIKLRIKKVKISDSDEGIYNPGEYHIDRVIPWKKHFDRDNDSSMKQSRDRALRYMGVEPSPFRVDSFFDVYTEISFKEPEWGTKVCFDSFFGVYVDNIFSPGGWGMASYVEIDTKTYVMGLGESPFIVDSFFDVFVEIGQSDNRTSNFGGVLSYLQTYWFSTVATGPISPPPENTLIVDSFFDVFTEFVVNPGSEVMGVEPSPFRMTINSESSLYTGAISGDRIPIVDRPDQELTYLEQITYGSGEQYTSVNYTTGKVDPDWYDKSGNINKTEIDGASQEGPAEYGQETKVELEFSNKIIIGDENGTVPQFFILSKNSIKMELSNVVSNEDDEYPTGGRSGGGVRTSGSSYSGTGVLTLLFSCSTESRDNNCDNSSLLEVYTSTAYKYREIENESDDDSAKSPFIVDSFFDISMDMMFITDRGLTDPDRTINRSEEDPGFNKINMEFSSHTALSFLDEYVEGGFENYFITNSFRAEIGGSGLPAGSVNQHLNSVVGQAAGLESNLIVSVPSPSLQSFLSDTFRGIGPVDTTVTDSGDIFTTNVITNNVTTFKSGTTEEESITVGDAPIGIASDDRYVYVTCLFDDDLYVISQSTGELVKTIPVGAVPIGVSVDETRNLVYVANFLSGDVTVIDSGTLQPLSYSPLPATNLATLMHSLGLSSSTLQSMFNQFFGGLGGGSNPLSALKSLYDPSTGSAGLQSLLSSLLNQFLGSLGIADSGGSIPFAGIQASTEISIIDSPVSETPGGIISIGTSIGNFGPNAFDHWYDSENNSTDDDDEELVMGVSATSEIGLSAGAADVTDLFTTRVSVQAKAIRGISNVTNPDPTTGGRENETDEELSLRVSMSLRNTVRLPGLNDTGGTKLLHDPNLNYGMICALTAVVIIGAVSTLGTNLETTFETVSTGGSGEGDEGGTTFGFINRINLTLTDNDRDGNGAGNRSNGDSSSGPDSGVSRADGNEPTGSENVGVDTGNESTVFKGEITSITDIRYRGGPNGTSKLKISSYSKMHVLTRTRTTRTWEDAKYSDLVSTITSSSSLIIHLSGKDRTDTGNNSDSPFPDNGDDNNDNDTDYFQFHWGMSAEMYMMYTEKNRTANEYGDLNYTVESFFDVTSRLDLGGGSFIIDSFFDVEVELDTEDNESRFIYRLDTSMLVGFDADDNDDDDGNRQIVRFNLSLDIGYQREGSLYARGTAPPGDEIRLENNVELGFSLYLPAQHGTHSTGTEVNITYRGYNPAKDSDNDIPSNNSGRSFAAISVETTTGGGGFIGELNVGFSTGEEAYKVKVKFPWLHDDGGDETYWSRIVVVMGGSGRGNFTLPEVDDEVLVTFIKGDMNFPYIIGAIWNSPPKTSDGINKTDTVAEIELETCDPDSGMRRYSMVVDDNKFVYKKAWEFNDTIDFNESWTVKIFNEDDLNRPKHEVKINFSSERDPDNNKQTFNLGNYTLEVFDRVGKDSGEISFTIIPDASVPKILFFKVDEINKTIYLLESSKG